MKRKILFFQEVLQVPRDDQRSAFNKENKEKIPSGKEYMKAENQWISFYKWYYLSANIIEDSLMKKFRNQAKQKRVQNTE